MKALLFVLMAGLFLLSPVVRVVHAEEDAAPSGAGAAVSEEGEAGQTEQTGEVRKPRALPFNSVIYSIDEEHRAYFYMGKHKMRKVYLTPETRLLLASGETATVEDLRVGAEVRGSTRKREDGHLNAVTVKIGAKERQ